MMHFQADSFNFRLSVQDVAGLTIYAMKTV